jgi:hypothetical protein
LYNTYVPLVRFTRPSGIFGRCLLTT